MEWRDIKETNGGTTMAQEEKAAIDYARERLSIDDYPFYNDEYEIALAFEEGAKWQKKQTVEKAIEHIKNHWDEILVYDCNQFGGYTFNMKKTLDNFRKAMEE